MAVGLDTFLSSCERDEVVWIMLTDAPTRLGWREWRGIETEHGLGLTTELLESAMDAGTMVRQPVKALAQLLLSAVIEAALPVADAGPDTRPHRARGGPAGSRGVVHGARRLTRSCPCCSTC
jgi:hypothetical protein